MTVCFDPTPSLPTPASTPSQRYAAKSAEYHGLRPLPRLRWYVVVKRGVDYSICLAITMPVSTSARATATDPQGGPTRSRSNSNSSAESAGGGATTPGQGGGVEQRTTPPKPQGRPGTNQPRSRVPVFDATEYHRRAEQHQSADDAAGAELHGDGIGLELVTPYRVQSGARLQLGRVHTVEDVAGKKVSNIGEVHRDYIPRLKEYYMESVL